MRDPEVRIPELRKTVADSITEAQFEARKWILGRIIGHLENSGDDLNHFYANLIRDWPTFVAYELNSMEGTPIFYTPWQLRAHYLSKDFDDVWMCCARQVGKTVFEATKALEHLMKSRNQTVMAIAPTADQLIVNENFRHFIKQSEFIKEQFLFNGDGAVDRATLTKFGANGSSFKPLNLSGDFKRGQTANVIMVDEFQLLTADDFDNIVEPMLSSSYGRKQLYRFMTPSYLYRPDLDTLWQDAQKSKDILTVKVDIWQALDEGIKKPTKDMGAGSVQRIFQNKNISCPFVEKCGACPGKLPGWFEGDVPDCSGCYEKSDNFLQEYMAEFPRQEERYFPASWLHAINNREDLLSVGEVGSLNDTIVMGVDLGGLSDPTEAIFNRYWREGDIIKMETVGRYHIPPSGGKGEAPNLDVMISKLQWMFHRVDPMLAVIDVTRKEYEAKALVSGPKAIPRGKIATNSTAERHGLEGIWLTGQEKARIYENHRMMISQEDLNVRGGSPSFWEDYFVAHTGVRLSSTSNASYPKFDTPSSDHILDAAAYASAARIFASSGPALHSFEFVER